MSGRVPIEHWQANIEAVLLGLPGGLKRVMVLRETSSTQDAARGAGCIAGDVIVAWRQTHGRGRFGRRWEDTGEDGVAMTITLPAERVERLSIIGGLAAARAIELACAGVQANVGIKWPNDVLANGRKIAGVLIECAGGMALMGIGINVHQRSWPAELGDRATSLEQLGVATDRLNVMIDVLLHLQACLGMSDTWLAEEFARCDLLKDTDAAFRIGQREVRGRVLRVEAMLGLAVRDEAGVEHWLPAATTTIVKD